ncbi:hypothetical protein Pcinc_026758 [Petrolisthes cinctipes]|uniref:Uncharacterized protein n=1 Tax=Petrolisthes cinctipes TaxID=88211 RepID=A0AAE1K7P7_PETCI|nr:hypothetical protein Pcinc_026758 [Petrolisthes cinctipes]
MLPDEKNKENQKNKENERNKLNWTTTTTTKRGESDQQLDGHAVADEIATLAKTIENSGGSKADLALT